MSWEGFPEDWGDSPNGWANRSESMEDRSMSWEGFPEDWGDSPNDWAIVRIVWRFDSFIYFGPHGPHSPHRIFKVLVEAFMRAMRGMRA
ncbi:MAG TPA: hypothetical protein DDW50_21785 [Firmicutes bacterium]|nr:hypothetical protein [Bacillota bacterium]